MIVDAYSNTTKPCWDNANIFSGQGAPEDCLAPNFQSWAAWKVKEEAEVQGARSKARELRGAPALADGRGDGNDATRGPGPKAKANGKGRCVTPAAP